MQFSIGEFVRDSENDYGPGKIIEVSGDAVAVEYFASITKRMREWVPADQERLTRYQPSPQERCYVGARGNWRMGRVKNLPDFNAGVLTYRVQYPNQDFGEVTPDDLYVRWWRPTEEPLDALLLHAHETPYFHDRRWEFVSAQVEQRSASRGLGGVMSSAVSLHPHQVDVVRRVMEDSVQRYLLADEVGLGKTIEAGMIARQVLIDDPLASVLVLVPSNLKDQWRRELTRKFFICDFTDRVQLVTLQEFQSAGACDSPDLLIVDEAHHIAASAFSQDELERRLYQRVAELAHESRSLLLLSATPVRRHEASFLSMLHMLEPDLYPLTDLEGFLTRLRARDEIARTLDGFTEAATEFPFLLEDALVVFERLFPKDGLLAELAGEMRTLIATESEDRSPLRACVRQTRMHIAETYRLHRRMVRYRRDGPAGDLVRGRLFAGTLVDGDSRREFVDAHLHLWLEEIAGAVTSGATRRSEYLALARGVLEAAGTWLDVLAEVLRARSDQTPAPHLRQPMLTELALLPGEEARLVHILTAISGPTDSDRVTSLLDWLQAHAPPSIHQPPSKVVVFTSYTKVAVEIEVRLSDRYPRITFACHHENSTATERVAAVDQFWKNPWCSVLVCDTTAEEGVNLQIADVLIHFDLPWDAERLEQRMGRVDRYGRGPVVRSFVVDDDSQVTTFASAIVRVMRHGFGVFDRSISAVQTLASEEFDQLSMVALEEGAVGVAARTEEVARRTQEMLRDARQQDQVDAVALQEDVEVDGMVDKIMECEAASLADRHDSWFQALGFRSKWEKGELDRDQLVTYAAHPDKTLISWNRLDQDFMQLAGPRIRRVGTYSRMAAVRNPGKHLLRFGEPLIDAMRHYLDADDRGQAFVYWRCGPEVSPDTTRIAFRANFVIEADLAVAQSVLVDGVIDGVPVEVLRRRLDAVFPPKALTIWICEALDVIEDPVLLDQLRTPYESDPRRFRDTNISPQRIHVLDDFISAGDWERLCRGAESRARELVRRQSELGAAVEEGLRLVHYDYEVRSARIRARMNVATREQAPLEDELEQEKSLVEALGNATQRPRVRLDSMGCIFVSGKDPFAQEGSGR